MRSPSSDNQPPASDPLLVSIRKAMTTIESSGYNPNVFVLTPAAAEALDTFRATATAAEQYYVFAPAQLAPRAIFGLNVRISKTAATPFVADSTAFGKLYASPVSLASVRSGWRDNQHEQRPARAARRVRN